jgi:hypothetical protein
MQVEQKRACGSCGSQNAADAGFCWRCLTPFVQVPPIPGNVQGRRGSPLPPVPPSWTPPGRSEAPSPITSPPAARSSKVVRTIVSIVAAAAGYLGVQYLLGPSLALPDSVAGAHRLTDAASQRFERDTADQGDRYGIDAEAGVYGNAVGPQFFVILVDAAAVETTDELFDALLDGFSKSGAVVDGAGAKSGTRRGSDYRCVSASAGSQTAAACMWRDESNVGIVLELSGDLRGTRRLLWTVHDTVVN